MDILKYSALKAINDSCSCIYGGANTAANTAGYNAGFAAAGSLNDATNWQANGSIYVCSQKNTQWYNDTNNMPWCYSSWNCLIPRLPGSPSTSDPGTNPATGSTYSGLKVCGTSLVAAASCTWTVPAGATYARFQIWGAGGSGGSACCCGGSTWGTSGAYASVIIPVLPGCQYTLCAGCARQSTTIWGSNTTRSCKSYVTGYGLSNFCAEGAPAKNHWCELYYDQDNYAYGNGCCKWSAPWCFYYSGSCICNSGYDFCFSGSCASCGTIGYSRNRVTNFYGCYTGSPYNTLLNMNMSYGQQVVGLPGLNGSMCFNTSFYGLTWAPAVYGFEASTATSICFAGSTTGGLCCQSQATGYRQAPGAGATASFLYGGCTAMCDPWSQYNCGGDVGRGGMVCVTYF